MEFMSAISFFVPPMFEFSVPPNNFFFMKLLRGRPLVESSLQQKKLLKACVGGGTSNMIINGTLLPDL